MNRLLIDILNLSSQSFHVHIVWQILCFVTAFVFHYSNPDVLL